MWYIYISRYIYISISIYKDPTLSWVFQHLFLTLTFQLILHLPTRDVFLKSHLFMLLSHLKSLLDSPSALTLPTKPFLSPSLPFSFILHHFSTGIFGSSYTELPSLLLKYKTFSPAIMPFLYRVPFSSLTGSLLSRHSSDVIFSRKATFDLLSSPLVLISYSSNVFPEPLKHFLLSVITVYFLFSSWTVSALRTGTVAYMLWIHNP